jgi:hypothetical protein
MIPPSLLGVRIKTRFTVADRNFTLYFQLGDPTGKLGQQGLR